MNINSSATINVVAKYLGHTKINETLNAYSHLFTNTLNKVVDIIDNLDNNRTDDIYSPVIFYTLETIKFVFS